MNKGNTRVGEAAGFRITFLTQVYCSICNEYFMIDSWLRTLHLGVCMCVYLYFFIDDMVTGFTELFYGWNGD